MRDAFAVLERASDTTDPDTLLDAALAAVCLAAEADVATVHEVGRVADRLQITRHRVQAPARVRRLVDASVRVGFVVSHSYRDAHTRTSRFLLVSQLGLTPAQEAAGWDNFARIDASDQLRMVVFDGPRFLAQIGAYRRTGEPGFSARQAAMTQALVPALRGIMTAASTRENASDGSPDERSTLLVRPDGRVEHASPGGARWLSLGRFREALRWVVRRWPAGLTTHRVVTLDGIPATVIPLQGRSGTRFLVEPTRAAPFVVDSGVVLSPTQKRVADLAACGLMLDEIAAELGGARETVKSHLRECYRRLGVSTRLELSRALGER